MPSSRHLTLLAIGLIATLGCPSGDTSGPGPAPATVDRVTVSPAAVNLLVGAQQALSATALASNGSPIAGKTAAWSSNNTSAATVSATTGLVTAVGAGTAIITAVIDGRTGQATVQVTVPTQRLTVTTSGTGSGTVTSSPAGIDCSRAAGVQTGTCVFDFPQGSVVTLTATSAAGGHSFGGWTGEGCAGLGPCQVTLSQARQVNALVRPPQHTLSVVLSGTGSMTMTSLPTGILCALTAGVMSGVCSASFDQGTVVTLSRTSPPLNLMTSWGGPGAGCGSGLECVITMSQTWMVTATALAPTTLSVTIVGAGRVTSQPEGIDCQRSAEGVVTGTCATSLVATTGKRLTATPATGFQFTGWTGASCPGTGHCDVTPVGAETVTATFTPVTQNPVLSVAATGSGSGVITSIPAGIACTVSAGVASGTCSMGFPTGTIVSLGIQAGVGSAFTGWSGGGCAGTGACQVTLNQGTQVTATILPLVPVTVVTAGNGNGTVTGSPVGINCTRTGGVQSGACGTLYPQGATITLTAQAAAGSTFTGWAGEGCSGTGSCIVQATQARTVTATFSTAPAVQHQLTVAMSGLGSGSVTSSPAGINCQLSSGAVSGACAAGFPAGTLVTLSVQLSGNATMGGWAGACAGSGTCQVTMNSAQSVSVSLGLPPAPLGIGFGSAQWAYIPAGTFTMGSTTGEPDEQPVRQVTISAPFLMQKTEVTQAQWRQVMGTSPSWFSACGDLCPVENVSWDEVWQFIAALNAQSPGVNFRLPTEAQWEYATRAGTTGDYSVPGGLTGFAWYSVNTGFPGSPRPVALLAPNPWGLYDVHGNVAEWVWDHYTPYTPGPQVDPRNVETEGNIVARGGSWFAHQYWLRSSARFWLTRQTKSYFTGFRLIRNP